MAIICMVGLFPLGGLFYAVSDPQPAHVSTDDGTWMQEGGNTLDRAKGLEGKCIVLTLNDEPHKDCTPQLLGGLEKRGVWAIFFLTGQNIEGNEDLVERMKEEGHLVGNHGYSHIQLTKAGSAAVYQAVGRTSRMTEDVTGEQPQYMCPPFGDWSEELEYEVGMTTVLWSVGSLDWKLRNKDKIAERVLKDVEGGDIILVRDIFPTSVDAALGLVDALTERGYTFVAVDELLIDQHCTVQTRVRWDRRMRRDTAGGTE